MVYGISVIKTVLLLPRVQKRLKQPSDFCLENDILLIYAMKA